MPEPPTAGSAGKRSARARRRRRGRPRARCASPTSGRCSPTGCAGDRPGRASAPATSPSARWCRCGRCRTGSWCCSGSTTGSSRAPAGWTATTCWPATRGWASATCGPRTGSCCSTPCCRPGSGCSCSYTGADPVSGARRPPAVPVGELLDTLDRLLPGAREEVVVRHPLQPHDPREFAGARPASASTRSALAGARRARLPRSAPAPRRPLPALTGPVALDDLVSFVEHPVRAYLRQRLRITLPGEDDDVEDALAVGLDGLQEWHVGERLLAAELAGLDPGDARHVEWLRGDAAAGPARRAGPRAGRAAGGPLVDAARPRARRPRPRGRRPVDRRRAGPVGDRAGRPGRRRGAGLLQRAVAAGTGPAAWVLALVLAAAGEGGPARRWADGATGPRPSRRRPPRRRSPSSAGSSTCTAGRCAHRCPWPPDLRGLRPGPRRLRDPRGGAGDRGPGAGRATRRRARRPAPRPRLGPVRRARRAARRAPPDGERWAGEPTRFGELARRFWQPVLEAESWT